MTWSIVSSVVNRLLGMTRCAGRSALFSIAFGFVCLAIFSPNRGILSPGALPNQRNGPSRRVSGSKNIQRIQAEGRSSSLTLAVTSDRKQGKLPDDAGQRPRGIGYPEEFLERSHQA